SNQHRCNYDGIVLRNYRRHPKLTSDCRLRILPAPQEDDVMSRDFRNSRSQTALSPATRRRKRAERKLLVETLERRELLATLTSGSGDGHLTVQVNEYGAFGRSGMLSVSQPFNQNGPREVDDAIYDPVGPIAAAGTIYESLLMIKVGS